MVQGYIKNRFKKRDDRSDLNPSYKRDTEAQIGELFFSRETGKLSFKKGVNDFVRYVDQTSALPYKVYTAILTQSGVGVPVATVLENTLEVEASYERGDSGDYYVMFNKTLFETQNSYVNLENNSVLSGNLAIDTRAVPVYYNVVAIQTYQDGLLSDDILGAGYMPNILEIRVYNDQPI